jgi:uncharacterized protein (TIGR02145 family)
MKPHYIFTLLSLVPWLAATGLKAQVTIGLDKEPARAALLEIKTKQPPETTHSITDSVNVTSEEGGLLLPRVKLVSTTTLEPFISTGDNDWITDKNSLKAKHAVLMVYNLTNDEPLYPAVYTWDGQKWTTSQANPGVFTVVSQPKPFTFYETGIGTVEPLTFVVDGTGAPFTYQWYQITGSNLHVRIGQPVTQGTGRDTASYTPTQVIKGTTRNANNAGMYRFYCVATNSFGTKLESQVAEVAVGCGAKNNLGEWITFMCFNLGASEPHGLTILEQKNYNIGPFSNDLATGLHTYIPGEENVYGDLYQWGRVRDGHQKRTSDFVDGSGVRLSHLYYGPNYGTTSSWPTQQIHPDSTAYFGKFIVGVSANEGNWRPLGSGADVMWQNGRYRPNDPCARYRDNGTYTDLESNEEPGTAWRLPSQSDWGEIYRGGTISGSAATATANTWVWNSTNGKGAEIRPDGQTTTLFLPANGRRLNGLFYRQGENGNYWSTTISGTNAYVMSVSSSVNPGMPYSRSNGFGIRCVKNQ